MTKQVKSLDKLIALFNDTGQAEASHLCAFFEDLREVVVDGYEEEPSDEELVAILTEFIDWAKVGRNTLRKH